MRAVRKENGGKKKQINPEKRPCGREEFWLHADSPMFISSAFGLESVHRPVRNRNLRPGLQPLKPLVIDRDRALVNTVSMKAVAAERKG
jgi:hypothetical protein